MFGAQNISLFVASGILLNLTPGQDTLYILGRSLAQGRRAGVLSVLGISCGSIVHTLAAAFGLTAILAASSSSFLAVKLIGSVYLVYLGIRMWCSGSAPAVEVTMTSRESGSSWTIFRAGMLTNILNPKVALFFLAFLPQFVDPNAESKVLAFLFLGSLFITTGTIWCMILALAAAAIRRRISASAAGVSAVRRLTGAVFMGLGVRLAVSR